MNRPRPITSTQYYLGLQYGYIIIPADVDRTAFIEQCYRWERVSILIERGGGVIHECYISREALRDITFPDTTEQLGSCVLFISDVMNAHPIIFAVLSKEDESQLLHEGYFKIEKYYHGNSVTIAGDAKKGVLNLTVDGGELTELNIMVSNKNKNATINIRCRGNIVFEVDGTLKINGGSEAMAKGTELKKQLDATNDYLKEMKAAVEAALDVLDPLVPASSKAAYDTVLAGKSPGDYTDIESKESFLD